jgi:hypothetical protein
MKFNVPFYKQTTPFNCGTVALKMVFSFLGKDFPIEEIEEKSRIKPGKMVSTLHLAIAALDLGFKIKFFSKYGDVNQENLESEFYKTFAENDYLQVVRNLIKELQSKGAKVEIKSIELSELLSYITEDSLPIALIDWNIIKSRKEKGYYGHFVPVVGYDKENVYIHNHGFSDTQAFMPIKKQLFDESRKSDGTDEDILIITKFKNENI